MSEVFRRVFGGIRPVDWFLAGGLTALGTWLMVENVTFGEEHVTKSIAEGTMVHQLTTHSWAMVPVFAVATVPVLWWRRKSVRNRSAALAATVPV